MRRLPAYLRPLWLVLIVGLGCSNPGGPSAGSLTVSVNGLPSGSSAAITVTGPGGFSQPVTATQTFTQLTPGTYTVAASDVTVGTSSYSPSPPNQTIAVNSNANASVLYATATGSLAITINGLGTASSAAVTVTGPNSYTQAVSSSRTIAGLNPGSYTVTARDTAPAGGSTHTASPTVQVQQVQARATATAMVTYTPPPDNGTVNLRIAGMYLTQSAQDYAGSIPLVKNRNGFLRVFVVADRVNTVAPAVQVQVRVYNGATLQSTIPISPPIGLTSVPTAADESSLSLSWNTPLSGTLIQPGLRLEAEVNPAPRAVVETDTTDNLLTPLPATVQTVPRLDVTFVPVIQRGNGLAGRVTTTNKDSFLVATKKMHPIDSVNAIVHAPYTTTTTSTLDANNTSGAWGTILGEIDALRVSEASSRYYYGVAQVTYGSGVAGVAYVSTAQTGARAALGWDYLMSGSVVAAHELGHNWGRSHAPCGGPTMLDPNYPRSDGSTGGYGVDVGPQTLEPPTNSDIMGYCPNKWISNYNYQAVFNYLLAPSPPFLGSVASNAVQPCLMVWGHIIDGEIVLEPAFQVTTRPSLPARSGPYSLEAVAADGSSLFALSFEPNEVADAQRSQQNFAFAVPLAASKAVLLSRLRVAGRGREAVALSQTGGAPDSVAIRRVSGGRVALRWNATAHPMVMVRDAETGQVLSFARGGDVELSTTKSQLDVVVSNGVKSHLKRMRVTR